MAHKKERLQDHYYVITIYTVDSRDKKLRNTQKIT